MRRLREPDFVAVDGIFDTAVACNFDGVNRRLCHKATAFVDESFAYIADDFFAYKRACHIVYQDVFGAACECVYAVFDRLPAFGTANYNF